MLCGGVNRMLWDSFPACQLADVPAALLQDVDVIGIDEGQFFPDLLEWCEEQMNKHHRMIVIAALDGTFQRAPFGKVLNVSTEREAFFFFVSVGDFRASFPHFLF
jgi:thymidine kinase